MVVRVERARRSAVGTAHFYETDAIERMALHDVISRWELLLAILVLNIPFGFWRAGVKKFSLTWFLAVHVPVIIGIGLRVLSKVGWSLALLPALIGCFFVGQYLGGRLRRLWQKRGLRGEPPGS